MLPELAPAHEEFRSHLARWVDERLAPAADEIDRTGTFAIDLFRELGSLGYFGIMYSEEYGGSAVESKNVLFTIMIEELSRASMAFAGTVGMHSSTATHGIFVWGSEALKQRYLVPSIRGEMIGAFALTEANAGSDAAAITTRVRVVDGGYVISGTKMFTSSSPIADFIIVAATTDPAKGARGIGLFLVDTDSPGFSIGRTIEKFLIHGSDTAETIYDDVFVPEECRLGDEQGFINAYESLTVDRIFTAALALGNAPLPPTRRPFATPANASSSVGRSASSKPCSSSSSTCWRCSNRRGCTCSRPRSSPTRGAPSPAKRHRRR